MSAAKPALVVGVGEGCVPVPAMRRALRRVEAIAGGTMGLSVAGIFPTHPDGFRGGSSSRILIDSGSFLCLAFILAGAGLCLITCCHQNFPVLEDLPYGGV
ncbi:unnamed protein product [Musa textilis]